MDHRRSVETKQTTLVSMHPSPLSGTQFLCCGTIKDTRHQSSRELAHNPTHTERGLPVPFVLWANPMEEPS